MPAGPDAIRSGQPRSAGPDCFLAVYGDTLWASAAFAVASPDDTATAVASSSTEAAVSGDPWAGLFEDLLAAYRSLAADVVTVTRDQLPVYRSIPVVDVVQGVELELREVLRSARAGAPAISRRSWPGWRWVND